MGIAIHVGTVNPEYDDGECDMIPLVGMQQLKAIWLPIVERLQSPYLDYCFSAGVGLDEENYSVFLEEMIRLGEELEKAYPTFREERNPATRWNDAIEIVKNNPPDREGSKELYIG